MKSKHILVDMDLFADTAAKVAMRAGFIQKQVALLQYHITETENCRKAH